MKLVITVNYDHAEIAKLIDFGASMLVNKLDTSALILKVKNSKNVCRGHAWPRVQALTDRDAGYLYLVTIGVGCQYDFPANTGRHKRNGGLTLQTWQECIVYLAAHELQHIADYQNIGRSGEARPNEVCYRAVLAYRNQQAI